MSNKLKTKSINFISAVEIKEKEAKKTINIGRILMVVLPIALLGIVAVSIVFLYGAKKAVDFQTDDINFQIETLKADQSNIALYSSQVDEYDRYIANYYSAIANIESQAQINKSIVNDIQSLVGEKDIISDFSYSEGTILLSMKATDYNEPALFVQKLRDTGLFYSVTYDGFATDGITYNYSVYCQLNN